MGKPLRLLNLTLGLVALLIAAALAKAWIAPTPSISGPSASKALQESVAVAFSRPPRPPLEQFDSLLERNPFKQPPPAPIVRPGSTPTPPPRPLPTLSGTMLVGDNWRAIVSDKGKAEIYAIGQEVAGGVITEIKEDRIVLKRGDATVEVPLKAVIEPARPPSGQAVPAQPASIAPPPIPPATFGAVPGAGPVNPPTDRFEKESRKKEMKAAREQLKLFRKQQKNN